MALSQLKSVRVAAPLNDEVVALACRALELGKSMDLDLRLAANYISALVHENFAQDLVEIKQNEDKKDLGLARIRELRIPFSDSNVIDDMVNALKEKFGHSEMQTHSLIPLLCYVYGLDLQSDLYNKAMVALDSTYDPELNSKCLTVAAKVEPFMAGAFNPHLFTCLAHMVEHKPKGDVGYARGSQSDLVDRVYASFSDELYRMPAMTKKIAASIHDKYETMLSYAALAINLSCRERFGVETVFLALEQGDFSRARTSKHIVVIRDVHDKQCINTVQDIAIDTSDEILKKNFKEAYKNYEFVYTRPVKIPDCEIKNVDVFTCRRLQREVAKIIRYLSDVLQILPSKACHMDFHPVPKGKRATQVVDLMLTYAGLYKPVTYPDKEPAPVTQKKTKKSKQQKKNKKPVLQAVDVQAELESKDWTASTISTADSSNQSEEKNPPPKEDFKDLFRVKDLPKKFTKEKARVSERQLKVSASLPDCNTIGEDTQLRTKYVRAAKPTFDYLNEKMPPANTFSGSPEFAHTYKQLFDDNIDFVCDVKARVIEACKQNKGLAAVLKSLYESEPKYQDGAAYQIMRSVGGQYAQAGLPEHIAYLSFLLNCITYVFIGVNAEFNTYRIFDKEHDGKFFIQFGVLAPRGRPQGRKNNARWRSRSRQPSTQGWYDNNNLQK